MPISVFTNTLRNMLYEHQNDMTNAQVRKTVERKKPPRTATSRFGAVCTQCLISFCWSFNQRRSSSENKPAIPLSLVEKVRVVYKSKRTVRHKYLVLANIYMCVDREKMRKDSNFKPALRDETVRQGAPTRDEVAIYMFENVYRGLNRMHTSFSRASWFKIL